MVFAVFSIHTNYFFHGQSKSHHFYIISLYSITRASN